VNPALWLLIRLQLVGWVRHLGRNLRTVKGALLALVGLAIVLLWLTSLLLSPAGAAGAFEPDSLRRNGPLVLVGYCLLNVLFSSSEKAIYFSPPEVNFLFPGPFSRRQILGYKIVLSLLAGLPSTLLLTFLVRVKGAWFPASFAGLLLVYVFLVLFSMVLGLLASSVGARLFSRGRQWALGLLVALAVLILWQSELLSGVHSPQQLAERAQDTLVWRVVSWPLTGFFQTMLAQTPSELIGPFLLGAGVDLALVGVIFALDADYLESSAVASARLYARLQRARGRLVAAAADRGEPARQGSGPRWTLPMLPWLGGIGPLVWRQLTTALRGGGRLVFLLVLMGLLVVPQLLLGREKQWEALLVLFFLAIWMTFFLTVLVPFDFRGDIDRLGVLKTLPIPPWRIAVGQLVVPTVILTAVQFLALAAACLTAPGDWPLMLAAALLLPAINFLLFGIENLLFLLFPVRLLASTPGDFQALGRNVLLGFAKVFILGTVGTLAGLLALAVGLLTRSLWAGVAVAWLIVAGSGILLVPFIALAFRAFDVGRDTPA
jgi:hypothetical protein